MLNARRNRNGLNRLRNQDEARDLDCPDRDEFLTQRSQSSLCARVVFFNCRNRHARAGSDSRLPSARCAALSILRGKLRRKRTRNAARTMKFPGLKLCPILGRCRSNADVMAATSLREMRVDQNGNFVAPLCASMYAFALNFFAVDAPDMERTSPKTGRLNQGRSCLPTIAHAIPW